MAIVRHFAGPGLFKFVLISESSGEGWKNSIYGTTLTASASETALILIPSLIGIVLIVIGARKRQKG